MFGIISGAKLAIYGAIALFIVSIVSYGYFHYTGLLKDLEVAKANEVKLLVAKSTQDFTIISQREAIEEWKKSNEAIVANYQRLATQQKESKREVNRLNEIFSKHDLTRLSKAKPGLIEKRLNIGTDNIFGVFDCTTSGGKECVGRDIKTNSGSPPKAGTNKNK